MIKKAARFTGLILLMAVFFVLAVAGNEKKEKLSDWTVRDDAPMQALGEVQSADIAVLARALGAQTPYLTASGAGAVKDARFDGGYARLLTWTDANGVIVSCARPAEAASLLRRDDLSPLMNESCAVGGMAGVLASGGNAACAYFGDVNAAYAVYAPGADAASLKTLLGALRFTD